MISHKSSDFGAECPFYFDALFYPGFTCTGRFYSFGRCVDRLNVQLHFDFFFHSYTFLFQSCFCHLTPVHVFVMLRVQTAAPTGAGVTKTFIIILSSQSPQLR